MESYLASVDTTWNYAFLFVTAIWSTLYAESWKRKQATIQYLWGLLEKEEQIKRSVKIRQRGAEYIFDPESGTKQKRVLNPRGCAGECTNLLIIIAFGSLAVLGIAGTDYLR